MKRSDESRQGRAVLVSPGLLLQLDLRLQVQDVDGESGDDLDCRRVSLERFEIAVPPDGAENIKRSKVGKEKVVPSALKERCARRDLPTRGIAVSHATPRVWRATRRLISSSVSCMIAKMVAATGSASASGLKSCAADRIGQAIETIGLRGGDLRAQIVGEDARRSLGALFRPSWRMMISL